MTQFTAAIFDMDGLLLDSERPIQDAWIEVCHRYGVPFDPKAYRGAVGLNARDSKAYLVSVLTERLGFDVAVDEVRKILDLTHPDSTFPLMPGARQLLELLSSRNVLCAVASSSDRAEVQRRLRNARVDAAFAAIAGGDEVARGKPSPDLYLLAQERLGLSEQAASVVFEDSEPGAIAGIAARMSVVLVPGLRPPAVEVQHQCLAVLPTLSEAIPLVERWFTAA